MTKLAKEYNLDIILAFSFIVFIIIFLLFITLHALGIIGKPTFITMPNSQEMRKSKNELSPSLICTKNVSKEGLEIEIRYTNYLDDGQLKYTDRYEFVSVTDVEEGIFAFEERYEEIENKVNNHNYFQAVNSTLVRGELSLTYDRNIDFFLLEVEGFTKNIGQSDGELKSFSIDNNIKLNSTSNQIKRHFNDMDFFCK